MSLPLLEQYQHKVSLQDECSRSLQKVLRYSSLFQQKVKVKFPLEQATKAQKGADVQLYSSFSLGTRWGGWSTPHTSRFTPGKDPVPIV